MRKCFVLVLAVFCNLHLFAQIRSVNAKVEQVNSTEEEIIVHPAQPFDSVAVLGLMEAEELAKLVHQTLYLKRNRNAETSGYYKTNMIFLTEPSCKNLPDSSLVYCPIRASEYVEWFESDYEQLCTKQFKVLEYFTVANQPNYGFFKMERCDNQDTVYLRMATEHQFSPWYDMQAFYVIEGLEASKQKRCGQDYVARYAYMSPVDNYTRIVRAEFGHIYKCVDLVMIADDYDALMYIMEDTETHQQYFYLFQQDGVDQLMASRSFMRRNSYNALAKKYGDQWNDIFAGNVRLGFTNTMCLLALGAPEDKNKLSGSWGIREQWVYFGGKLYIYFENGVVTSIQN